MHLLKGLFLMLGLFVFSNSISAQGKAVAVNTPAKPVISNVDVTEFKKMMTDGNVIILDVRTPREVAQGAVPNAQNINLFGNFVTDISKLDKSKTYLVYCRSGRRSVNAANKMANAGFTKIYNLLGGYNAYSR